MIYKNYKADYANDLALLTNTFASAEFLLHNLEKAARGIGLFMSSVQTRLVYFKQDATYT